MFFIDPHSCTACSCCVDACPCDAIKEVNNVYTIDPDLCVECGNCYDACEFGSIFEAELDRNKMIPKRDI